jgi:hypothetical protein
VLDAHHHLLSTRPLERGQHVRGLNVVHEMGMTVDQPGCNRGTGEIDQAGAGGSLRRPGLDSNDRIAADQDQSVPQHLTALHVDQAAGTHGQELLGASLTGAQERGARGSGEHE